MTKLPEIFEESEQPDGMRIDVLKEVTEEDADDGDD